MIYLYDDAIITDLQNSFNPDNAPDPIVTVIDASSVVNIVATLQNDNVRLPLVSLKRRVSTPDSETANFTRIHKGVASVLDPDTNELYYERMIPWKLEYDMNIYTSNQADMDEITKELLFKYSSMYFITLQLPYECKRKIRFGVYADFSQSLEVVSSNAEYLQEGKLYQSTIPIKCDGCVIVSYTAAKLRRQIIDKDIEIK